MYFKMLESLNKAVVGSTLLLSEWVETITMYEINDVIKHN